MKMPRLEVAAAVAVAIALSPLSMGTAQTSGAPGSKMTASSRKAEPSMKTAASVQASAIVIDTHADTTQRMLDQDYDLASPLNGGHVNFEAAKKGNLGAEFFSIWVEPKLYQGRYVQRTLDLIDAVYQQAAKHPDQMRMAYSPDDILAAHREHKLAALMGIEGGHSIDSDIRILRDYYRLGIRYMTLTWSNSNGWADSSGDATDASIPHTENGLSEFGKDVVYEMNRLGMMVDISHVSDKTFYRTLIITRAPVIASHSSARALCNSPRNMTDDMLRAMNVNGGVVMVNFYSAFISEDFRKAYLAQKPERDKATQAVFDKAKAEGRTPTYAELDAVDKSFAAKIPRPPFSMLIDHIDHIAKVAGIDHVGIGSDFDGIPSTPEGIDSAADLPKITAALMQRGYSAADCDKILGGNLLRVFREVEAVSKQLQAQERPQIIAQQPFKKQPK
jgi:membrane dipeptidase